MNNLRHILSKIELQFDEIIYVLFCGNDKFYVGHTTNLVSRMKYGHFSKHYKKIMFLNENPPIELLFIIETGISSYDLSLIHGLEDYATVVVSKKYGAENVFGGFRHIKCPSKRKEFVKRYKYSTNRDIVDFINQKIDFELPDLSEIRYALFGAASLKKKGSENIRIFA